MKSFQAMLMRLWLWFEQRLELKSFFLRPVFPRSVAFWFYLPGILAIFLLLWQGTTGIILAFDIRKVEDISHTSLYLRSLHRLGANLLVISFLLHLIFHLYTGIYRTPGEILWFTGMILFLLLIASLCTGAILPFSPGAKKTLEVFSLLLRRMPLAGAVTEKMFRFSMPPESTWHAIYIFHIVFLPWMIMLTTILYLWLIQRRTIVLESQKKLTLA